jgi:diguanylate cyclase (GGDEF)-like protein/PAS domain S-box-containing protein
VLSWAAVTIGSAADGVALWWPAAGAAVAAYVTARPNARVAVLVVVLVVSAAGNAIAGRPLLVSVLFGVANAAEAAVAGWWLTRDADDRPSLFSLADLWRLLTAAALGATTIAVGATLTVTLVAGGSAWPVVFHVFASHFSAVLLITPMVMRTLPERSPASRVETLVQIVLLAVGGLLSFGLDPRVTARYLVLIPLIWGALRLRLRVVTIELFASMAVGLTLAASGLGPFGADALAGLLEDDDDLSLLRFSLTQVFVITTSLTVLIVAITAAQGRSLIRRIERSERILRGGFDDALVGTAILHVKGPDVEVVEVNDVAEELLGIQPDDTVSWTTALGPEAPMVRAALRQVADGLRPGWRAEVELYGHEGRHRWAELAAAALSGEDDLVVLQLAETTARKAAERELEQLALYDPVTDLPNRTLLRDRGEQALRDAARRGGSVALVFLDLDDFKRINDTAGHSVGDEVLREFGARLSASVRVSDTVARLGGDEFVVLLPGSEPGTVETTIDRIRATFDEPVPVASGAYRITASIGYTSSTEGSTIDDLLRDADTAMYVAKGQGPGRATPFMQEFRERNVYAVTIAEEFEGAIERGEVVLFVQPIVDLDSRRVDGAEALVRWRHPERGLLAPDAWLDIVSRGGSGPDLEAWIIGEACRILADWSARWGDDSPVLHVNISTALLRRGDMGDEVLDALGKSGAPTDRLVVELTETDLESVRGSLLSELEALRDVGVRVAVDDFGTGYSAFSRLAHLPLDDLKIDSSFVAQMLTDERSRTVVVAILGLAQALGLSVVAEGVETADQADALRELGCDRGQGYLWARPMTVADFVQAWERHRLT